MGFIDFIVFLFNSIALKRDIRWIKNNPRPFLGCLFVTIVVFGFLLIVYSANDKGYA
jgi:hypothetical protein